MSEQNSTPGTPGIAVVGMAGRFPGAENVERFWANLAAGIESVRFFRREELLAAGVDPVQVDDPAYVPARAALDGAELFDAGLFGYSPREAEVMDPQHRLLLECAWEALEHAGYDPRRYDGLIGVYAGAGPNAYLLHNLIANREALLSAGQAQALIANGGDFLATRVSYKLELRGPSLTVQTACSTSLVAVHLAVQSLLNGECDLALAGGVRISVPRPAGYLYQTDGILASDGHCRPFDAAAQGTVDGEGAGLVVLKRLEEAVAGGDPIHAVILGTAINNDGGARVGYTAPGVEGRAAVVAMAQAVAGVHPETVGFIEGHGTATALGDPIEVAALRQVFEPTMSSGGRKSFCALGSVKANVGHLDAAAGVTSLIKAVLALEHGLIPSTPHFQTPNPKLGLPDSPFFVNAESLPWPPGEEPRRAGVSSFGMGGTNAHVVLEEAPPVLPGDPSGAAQILVLSAATRSGSGGDDGPAGGSPGPEPRAGPRRRGLHPPDRPERAGTPAGGGLPEPGRSPRGPCFPEVPLRRGRLPGSPGVPGTSLAGGRRGGLARPPRRRAASAGPSAHVSVPAPAVLAWDRGARAC